MLQLFLHHLFCWHRLDYRLVAICDTWHIHLDNLSVICNETVDFTLNVCSLSIHCSRTSRLDEYLEHIQEGLIMSHHIFSRLLVSAIAPLSVDDPCMSFYRKTDSSVLSEYIDELTLEHVHCRTWIVVNVKDISESLCTLRKVVITT